MIVKDYGTEGKDKFDASLCRFKYNFKQKSIANIKGLGK